MAKGRKSHVHALHVTDPVMRLFASVAAIVVLVTGVPAQAQGLPEVRSKGVAVLDVATGAAVFGRGADDVRAIASTTQIFVALAVRRRGIDLDGWTEISRVDVKHALGGARTRLDVGQTFRNADLLRAMLMASDNRAPTALGRAVGLDPPGLVKAMNQLARELGLRKTRFTDPSGLRGNVSTAREMALALRVVLRDRVLRQIMATDSAVIRSKSGYAKLVYGNTNEPLLARRFKVSGGKTGYTVPAGYCYVTGAEFRGREVVMAFLGAEGKQTRFADFGRIATWLEAGAPGSRVKLREAARPERPKLRVSAQGKTSR
jgi:D-alanyl-D-alanine endopeptidase (penicillin-binding protein 7)